MLIKDKADIDAVIRLSRLPPQQLIGHAEELLRWLQDGNWPVAYPVSRILYPHVKSIQPLILSILIGNDLLWKYWVILFLLIDPEALDTSIQSELKRIKENPSPAEIAEGLPELL